MKLLCFSIACLLGLFGATGTAAASARRHEDMFIDKSISTYGRPWVASDVPRGQDMFRPVPVMLNRNADLFGNVKPVPISTRGEMFVVRKRRIPYESPIFTNDGWTN